VTDRELPEEYTPEMVARVSQMIRDFVPHNRAIGMEVDRVEGGQVWMRLPWDEKLVGNPVTGVVHGGVISTLMDATCGLAVMMALGRPMNIATLDLRIDYLKPATPHRTIVAWASCFKVTKHVCFVRGAAFHRIADGPAAGRDETDDPIASVAGTFARKSGGGGT
jgi:uncharacterized protein (TIGR00369 family)